MKSSKIACLFSLLLLANTLHSCPAMAGDEKVLLLESGLAQLSATAPYSGLRIYSNGDVEAFNELPRYAKPPRTIAKIDEASVANLERIIQRIQLDKTPLKLLPLASACYGGMRKIMLVQQNAGLALVRDDDGPCNTLVPQNKNGLEDRSEFALSRIVGAWEVLEEFSAPPAPPAEGGMKPPGL